MRAIKSSLLFLLAASCGGSTAAPGDASTDGGTQDTSVDVSVDSGIDADADAAPPPPSCVDTGAGRTTCSTVHESCCTSPVVQGGMYDRTYTNGGSGATGAQDPATVSSFRLDKYEVTVGRFRQFVTAWNGGAGWTPAEGAGKHTHLNGGQGLEVEGAANEFESGWSAADNGNIAPTSANLECDTNNATWTNAAGQNEMLPINCVNWWEAYAFCIWDDAFLPSESEWEYAAAGGALLQEYPWGSADPELSSAYAIYDCDYPAPAGCSGLINIAPVGLTTSGASAWGQLDLAGNMWEWVLDWQATYATPCTDCASLTSSSMRVIRGGSFIDSLDEVLPPFRFSAAPSERAYVQGFRCARTP